MKNLLYFLTVLLVFVSCESDEQYEQLNKDPNKPVSVEAKALFTAATVSLFDALESTNVNRNIFRMVAQYWTQTQYIDEANFDLQNRNIPQNFWSELYRDVLYDLKNAKELTANNAEKAQIEVIEVYTWQILVETFGDIPYNEALNGQENPLPAYDDAATIYNDLIKRLDEVLPNFSGTGFVDSDVIYGGDLSKWKKLANSLKLKLAVRINNSTAISAAANGAFTSNADNASISFESSTPNTNPLWVDLVQSGRNDFVPANTIVDIMNDLEDPRRSIFFDDNISPFSGGIYGDSNAYALYTHIGKSLLEPTFRGVLMDYAEVEFLMAYAGLDNPEDHYFSGITASFDDWGVTGISNYITKQEVEYSRDNLGKQFWIAMYNRGMEGWSVYRMFDGAITFNLPADTGNPIPTRFTYPVNEQTLNETNYNNVSSAIGGDTQTTRIFWDSE